jgi:dienelactone hydrolase
VGYDVEGARMVGQLALPGGDGRRPAVLVFPEGPGLGEQERRRARLLADLGYVAFVADYHGDGRVVAGDEMMARVGELSADWDKTTTIVRAGLDVLLQQDRVDPSRVAAIGYCFGGTLALELGRGGADLRAIVAFLAGLATAAPSCRIAGSVLVCTGADDPFVPPEQRDAFAAEMTAAGVDWQLHVYGGTVHSFTNPDASHHGQAALAHHPRSDARSWASMLALFGETLA